MWAILTAPFATALNGTVFNQTTKVRPSVRSAAVAANGSAATRTARKTQPTRFSQVLHLMLGQDILSVCPRRPHRRATVRPLSSRFADSQFAFAVKPPCPQLYQGGGEDACGDIVSVALRQGWAARRQNQSSEPSHKQTQSVRLLFCYAFTLIIQQWLADKVSVPLSPNNRPISSPLEWKHIYLKTSDKPTGCWAVKIAAVHMRIARVLI